MYKNIIVLLIFLGILLMTINIVKDQNKCQKKEIVYKYIPRTDNEFQQFLEYPSDIFDDMFTQPSPWVSSIKDIDEKELDSMKKYFTSQYN